MNRSDRTLWWAIRTTIIRRDFDYIREWWWDLLLDIKAVYVITAWDMYDQHFEVVGICKSREAVEKVIHLALENGGYQVTDFNLILHREYPFYYSWSNDRMRFYFDTVFAFDRHPECEIAWGITYEQAKRDGRVG